MMKKYELTDESKTLSNGTVLHRIMAVRDFVLVDGTMVHAGDLGGWIETEDNLSHIGKAWVLDNAQVFDNARISSNAKIFGNAEVRDWALVGGDAEVSDEANVYETAYVSGCAEVCGNARIKSINDYAVFKNTWSSGRWFTYTRSNKMWKVGCFYGTSKELIAKAYKDSELSGQCYKAVIRVQETIDKAIEKAQRTK